MHGHLRSVKEHVTEVLAYFALAFEETVWILSKRLGSEVFERK